MAGFQDLKDRMTALETSNTALGAKVEELKGDVAESVGFMQTVSVAALVLKDAYDVLVQTIQQGGTPEEIAEMITRADALIASQGQALAKAQEAKDALDATDASQAALPDQIQP